MPIIHWLSLLIIILTIIGVAVGRYPFLRMNRATIALVGATALILLGAISLESAYASLDMNTLVLLFGMMILNTNLRMAGFFGLVGHRVVAWARTPRQLLGLVIIASGVLSAIFLNDTIVLVFTPLVLGICRHLRRDPIPYLLAVATAANIGSVATITGNPQNMIIGVASGIPFLSFTASLAPVALVGMGIVYLVISYFYPGEFGTGVAFIQVDGSAEEVSDTAVQWPLLRKGTLTTGLMLLAFVAGMPVPLAALTAASILLITRRVQPEEVFREVDWSLLVFFSGLFIVTGSLETLGVGQALFAAARPITTNGVVALTGVSVILSNLISNVPAVLLFRPFMPSLPHPEQAWLVLAMATTLAGNLTLLGSVANLIVAESAQRQGVHLSFGTYLRVGFPVTLLTVIVGTLWLTILF